MSEIKKLLEQTIVIEGLLRNIEAHKFDPHPDYAAQLSVKFEEFQETYYKTFPPNQSFVDDHHDADAEVVEIVEMDEVEMQQHRQPAPTPISQRTQMPQPQQWPVPNPAQAPQSVAKAPTGTQPLRPTPMPQTSSQRPYQPQPLPSQQSYQHTPMPQSVPQQAYQPQPISSQIPSGMQQPPRVDEALSRRKAENLSKAFTINDKYRFGQALYFGNNELMNEQIKAAQNFNNYQQAYDLFVSGNKWDVENPLVKEFMAIVSRHFQQS